MLLLFTLGLEYTAEDLFSTMRSSLPAGAMNFALSFGPGLAATLHVAATFTGSGLVELPSFSHEVSLLEQPITAKDGTVAPPSGPGLGVAINPEAVRRYSAAS